MANLVVIPRAKDLYTVAKMDGNKIKQSCDFFTSTFNPKINLPGVKVVTASAYSAQEYYKAQQIYTLPMNLTLSAPLKTCVEMLIKLVVTYGTVSVNNHNIKSLYFVSSRDFLKPTESWLNKPKPILRLLVTETSQGPKISAYMGKITFSTRGIDIKMGGKSRDAVQDCINLMRDAKMFAIT